jgi:hypothetical protein
LLFHHVRGVPCLGAGFPPIEESDARLAELAAELALAERAAGRELAALYDRRANWIDPALVARRHDLGKRADSLARRLKRHRSWPERFARQMERDGWGMPPPAYLLTRDA